MSAGETVTIRPGVEYDDNNDPVPGSGAPFTIDGCVVEPLGSTEAVETERRGVVDRLRIYAPGPVPHEIPATAEVLVRGRAWQLVGDADEWIDDDPDLSGPVLTVQRARG